MEDYIFYRKYTNDIFVYRNTVSGFLNLAKVGENKLLLEHDAWNIQHPTNGFGIVHGHYDYYIDLEANNRFPWLTLVCAYPFNRSNMAIVQTVDLKYNVIDHTGTFLFKEGFIGPPSYISENFYIVDIKGSQFILDLLQGKLFQEVWKL